MTSVVCNRNRTCDEEIALLMDGHFYVYCSVDTMDYYLLNPPHFLEDFLHILLALSICPVLGVERTIMQLRYLLVKIAIEFCSELTACSAPSIHPLMWNKWMNWKTCLEEVT